MQFKLIGAAAISLLASVPALAEPRSEQEEIVVTARRLEEELPQILEKSGTRVDVIDAASIRRGGYIDTAQSLQSLAPGLYVAPKNGAFDYVDLSFQGSRTQDILWLVDGVRINNRLYAGTTPLDTLPSSMVERIEILEGGQALFYGTQAGAGAINVVTKAFADKPDGALTLGGDTNGGKHLDGYFRTAMGKHRLTLYGSGDQSKGIKPYPDADFQPSSTDRRRGYRVASLGGKYALDLSDDLRFSASYQHTDAKLDYANPQLAAESFNERDEDLLSAKIDYTASERIQLFVKGYYHWWNAHFRELDNVIGSPGTFDVVDDHDFWGFKDYGANLLTKLSLNPGFDAFVGYDFQNYNGRDDVLVIEQQTERVHAVFGQIRTTPNLISNAILAAGFRYNMPSVGKSALVWNVSGKYDVSDTLFIRGMAGTAFRLPTAEELFANDPLDERGNPDLKPEESKNANLSVGGTLALKPTSLKWEIIGFYRRITNLIALDSFDAATNQDVFGNIPGAITMKGVTLSLDAAISDALSANLNVTYNKARQSGTALQFNRIPGELLKAGLDYHPANRPFGAGFTVNYVGDLHDTLGGGIGRLQYGHYVIADFNARLFLDPEHRHRFNASLENAFNEKYASRLSRGIDDISAASYTVHNRGLPRTFRLSYTLSF